MPKFKISSIEKSDATQLLVILLTVPLTWVLFLAWPWGEASVAFHDALSMHYPVLRDFILQGSDWKKVLYRPQIMGGVAIHDMGLLYLPFTFFGKLGLGPVAVLNATLFTFQGFFAFVSYRIAIDLCAYLDGRPRADFRLLTLYQRVAMTWLTAFAPIVGWRILYGHPNLILGAFPILFTFSLLLSAVRGTFGWVLAICAALGVWIALPSAGQQMIAYGAIFGVPLLIAFAWPHRHEIKSPRMRWAILSIGLILLGALGVAMLRYAGILHIPFAGDLARQTDGTAVYSFPLISLMDFLSAIPWNAIGIRSEKMEAALHEYQLTVGPLFLLVALIPWKKIPKLAATLVVLTIIAIFFSLKIPPVSWVLAHRLSPLASFRCPHRVLLLFGLFVPAVAATGILYRFPNVFSKQTRAITLAAFLLGGILLFAPPMVREAFAWAIVISLLVFAYRNRILAHHFAPAIVVLALLSVSFVDQRRMPYAPSTPLENPEQFTRPIREKSPEYHSPLFRVLNSGRIAGFGANTPYATGLSTIDGYWYPSLRFLSVASFAENSAVRTTTQLLQFPPQAPVSHLYGQLYNVRLMLSQEVKDNNTTFHVKQYEQTAGPAWFSKTIAHVPTLKELSRTMTGHTGKLHLSAKEFQWIADDDSAVRAANLPATAPPACAAAQAANPDVFLNGQVMRIAVTTPAECPLTVSSNYFSNLVAHATTGDGQEVPLKIFPAYGSLIGVWVTPETKTVTISANAYQPAWAWAAFILGLLAWCAAPFCLYQYRRLLMSNIQEETQVAPSAAA